MRCCEPEKENPDSAATEIGVQDGIKGLQNRVERYGRGKKNALAVADFMAEQDNVHLSRAEPSLRSCGSYLLFSHFFTVDQVKLTAAKTCNRHLLCQFCAMRRGAKFMESYDKRLQVILSENPLLRLFLVTLTVKDGPDLRERFNHLQASLRELWKQKHRGRVFSPLAGVAGAVWSTEIKHGANSGLWHPHTHMLVLAESLPTENVRDGTLGAMSAAWHNITRDSFMVDVRPISQDDPRSGFAEVFKYAVKAEDKLPQVACETFLTLRSRRLIGSAGLFRGVPEPVDLLDDTEALEGLPYLQFLYRFTSGGYALQS